MTHWAIHICGSGGGGTCRRAESGMEKEEMTTFGEDLIEAMGEALAHAKGTGPAITH